MESADHMFKKMQKFNINSQSSMKIHLNDIPKSELCEINFQDKKISFGDDAINCNQIRTTLFIESNYLQAILDRKSHWNNAIISLNLDWEREPNIFDRGWFDALNFLHTYPD